MIKRDFELGTEPIGGIVFLSGNLNAMQDPLRVAREIERPLVERAGRYRHAMHGVLYHVVVALIPLLEAHFIKLGKKRENKGPKLRRT